MTSSRIILLIFIAAVISAFFYFDLGHYLTLETLKSQQSGIENYRAANPLLAIAVYALVYIAVTGLSLPGVAILTLAGGAVFVGCYGELSLFLLLLV